MPTDQEFLSQIQSSDKDVRFAAWRAAGSVSPAVIPQLAKLNGNANPGIAKAAREALTTLTHAVGKDPAAPNRAAVVKGLLAVAATADYAPAARVNAIRLLSNIAAPTDAAAIAKLLSDAAYREEAVFAIERIPGPAATQVLIAALPAAPDDFKPRLLAALGHRRDPAAGPALMEAVVATGKPDIAIAAFKALGRLGVKLAGRTVLPDVSGFSEWQKLEMMDSILRYAEALTKAGSGDDAIKVYRLALHRPEPHMQCAAVIGLAKVGSQEAVDAILTKLKSDNQQVRITAQNAWKSIAQ